MTFWTVESRHTEAGLFLVHFAGPVAPLLLAVLPFLGRGLLRVRSRRL